MVHSHTSTTFLDAECCDYVIFCKKSAKAIMVSLSGAARFQLSYVMFIVEYLSFNGVFERLFRNLEIWKFVFHSFSKILKKSMYRSSHRSSCSIKKVFLYNKPPPQVKLILLSTLIVLTAVIFHFRTFS